MKNKIAAVVLAATMVGTVIMPTVNVFATESAEDNMTVEDTTAVSTEKATEVVVKNDAKEADFDGVWKISGARLFGEALSAEDYGMDDSFVTIKDGKMDIYGEGTDVSGLEMTFEDGKYILKLDEDFMAKVKEEEKDAIDSEMSIVGADEFEAKLKEVTAGNSSALEFQLTEDGQLAATCEIDIENEYLTFSTSAIQILADKSSEADLDAAKKAAEESFAASETTDGVIIQDNVEDETEN